MPSIKGFSTKDPAKVKEAMAQVFNAPPKEQPKKEGV